MEAADEGLTASPAWSPEEQQTQLNKVRQLLQYDALAARSCTFFNACGCDLALLGKVELVNDKGGDCQQHDHGQHNEGDGDSRGPTGQELGRHLIRASRTRHLCIHGNQAQQTMGAFSC